MYDYCSNAGENTYCEKCEKCLLHKVHRSFEEKCEKNIVHPSFEKKMWKNCKFEKNVRKTVRLRKIWKKNCKFEENVKKM